MFDKVNVKAIISDHLSSFYDFRSSRRSWSDIILFWGTPICVAGICAWKGLLLSTSSVNSILTAFSIFAGLLFNLLIMVLTFLQTSLNSKVPVELSDLMTRKQILREVTANLSFSILLSIAIVAVSVVAQSMAGQNQYYIDRYASGILVIGTINFSLTLVMLLKRMYKLMQFEFDIHKFTNSGNRAA